MHDEAQEKVHSHLFLVGALLSPQNISRIPSTSSSASLSEHDGSKIFTSFREHFIDISSIYIALEREESANIELMSTISGIGWKISGWVSRLQVVAVADALWRSTVFSRNGDSMRGIRLTLIPMWLEYDCQET